MKNDTYRKILVFLIVLYKAIMYYPGMNNMILYAIVLLAILIGTVTCRNKRFTKKSFSRILLISLLFLLSIINTESANFVFIILIVLNFDKKGIKELLKYFAVSIAICMGITILLNLLNIIPSNNLIRYEEYGENVNYAKTSYATRYSLGFLHPGFVGVYVFFLTLSYYCYTKNKKKFLLTLPLVILMYMLCKSRSLLVSYVFLWGLILISERIQTDKLRKIAKYSFVCLTIISILAALAYSKYKMEPLNIIFSGRLEHYYAYIKNGLLVHPFGSEWISGYTIDNFFLYWFFDFGFVGYTIMLFLITKSVSKIDNKVVLLAILSMYLYGLFDSTVAISNINPFMSILFIYLVNDTKAKNDLIRPNGGTK